MPSSHKHPCSTLLVISILTLCLSSSLSARPPEEYEGILPAPFQNLLDVFSLQLEKQMASEMLGVVLSVDPLYRNDEILLRNLRTFQTQLQIPSYDFQFCLAGPLTLNYLIEHYLQTRHRPGSYYRQLLQLHDPAANPQVTNLGGVDIAEFQIMYNFWAADNSRPAIITPGGEDNGSWLLTVDGYYGKFTKAAALNFQLQEDLLEKKDGVVAERTWKLLYVRTYLYRDQIVKQLFDWSNNYLPTE